MYKARERKSPIEIPQYPAHLFPFLSLERAETPVVRGMVMTDLSKRLEQHPMQAAPQTSVIDCQHLFTSAQQPQVHSLFSLSKGYKFNIEIISSQLACFSWNEIISRPTQTSPVLTCY